MGKNDLFRLDNYIPQYSSEEARITDYLRELYNIVPLGLYNEIYSCFMQTDKKGLADFLVKVYKERKQIAGENKQLREKVMQLENEQEDKTRKIEALEKELNNLRCRGIGIDPAKGSQIKQLYEEGWSLRKIGAYCGCDKSTVKRMLEKMGVQVRNKSGDCDAPGQN